VKQSGLADSPFFSTSTQPSEGAIRPIQEKPVEEGVALPSLNAPTQSSNQATMQPSKHASLPATIVDSIIETIRKAVKGVGKEAGTFRFTPEEKKALLELAFTYKVKGFKTSENELTRIAVNFILEDHRQNGRGSILEKVLQALDK
jgi:hypothetical protein